MSLADRLILGLRGSRPGDERLERDLDACAEAGVVGVVLFEKDIRSGEVRNVESPTQVAELIAHVRERLGDVVVSIDQEGGRVARLKPSAGFAPLPSPVDLATMPVDERRGVLDASCAEMARLGITLNFAPGVDVAVNPDGPVMAALGRCFSADPSVVAEVAGDVIDAHVLHGITPCLKHFPGHGSANEDSHHALPDVTDVWQRDIELAPFKAFAQRDDLAIMTAHLVHRDLDPDRPASLSKPITTGLLRSELGFRGTIVTDSLDMAGARVGMTLSQTLRRAADAGADWLLHGCNSALDEFAADVIAAANDA
ncbi:MAG: glycoside hydrolase family 3 N-terminal domain-containing protein [Planctomycetota bacterium]